MTKYLVAGALLGAVPATVMEFIQPAWEPSTLTAFAMPMLACATAGLLAWLIIDTRKAG